MLKPQDMEDHGKAVFARLKDKVDAYDCPDHSVTLRDKTSVYKVSSALQKCIRRGLVDKAVYYAQALLNSTETEYLWRRLPVIALEDIGVADVSLCSEVLHFCRFKEVRLLISQKRGLSYLVHQLAAGVKSRTLTDMMCSVLFTQEQPGSAVTDWMTRMTAAGWKPDDLTHWAYGAPVLSGPDDRFAMVQELQQTWGMEAAFLFYSSSKKSVFHLHANLKPALDLVIDSWVTPDLHAGEHTMIKNIPDWAFDQHTHDGKKAFRVLLNNSKAVKSLGWAPNDKQIGMVLFQTESAVLDKKLNNPNIDKIQFSNDWLESQHVGLQADQYMQLVELMHTQEFKADLLYARRLVLGALGGH